MPNWGDDEDRFWWWPEEKSWQDAVEIPHPPVSGPRKGCKCAMCSYERAAKKSALSE